MKSDFRDFKNTNNIYLPQPKDLGSWWSNLHRAWGHIYKILDLVLDLDEPPPDITSYDEDEIAGANAEEESIADFIRPQQLQDDGFTAFAPPETLGQYLCLLEENEDQTLLFWLNDAWLLGPDTPEVYAFPGWTVLTDLISEKHLVWQDMTQKQLDILNMDNDEYFMFIMGDTAKRKQKDKEWQRILLRSKIIINLNLKKRQQLAKELEIVNAAAAGDSAEG